MSLRTCTYTRTVPLEDGTTKTTTFTNKYIAKTERRNIGKEDIRKRLVLCNDKEKIDKLKIYMDEIGMLATPPNQ
jgi:hypothetical protein